MTPNNVGSIVQLVLSREYNFQRKHSEHESEINFRYQSQRLLIKGRTSKQDSGEFVEPDFKSLDTLEKLTKSISIKGKKVKKNPKSKKLSMWTSFREDAKSRNTIFCIDDKLVVRSPQVDIDKTFYKVYLFTPSKFDRNLSLQYTFEESGTRKWENFAVWYPSDYCNSNPIKWKQVSTLIVLQKPIKCPTGVSQQKMCLYNFNNGKRLMKSIETKGCVTYNDLGVHREECKIVLKSCKASIPKDMVVAEFLIFSTPPVTLISHLQIQTSAVSQKDSDVEIEGSFFIVTSRMKSLMELSSLAEVMALSAVVPRYKQNDREKYPVTHALTEKPVVIWKVSTDDRFINFQDCIAPPIYVTKRKHLFSVNFQGEVDDCNEELLIDEDRHLDFHPELPYHLIPIHLLYGSKSSGFCVYSVERKEGSENQSLRKVFPKLCLDMTAEIIENPLVESQRVLRRRRQQKSYVLPEGEVYGMDYNYELNLFVIATLRDTKTIQLVLYESYTMDVFHELPTVNLPAQDRASECECSQFIVDFQSMFVTVSFECVDKKRRIYCCSFTGTSQILV